MTKLKFTIALDDNCSLTLNDTSGFYDADTNINGFLTETNSDDLAFKVYKISHGYFLNVLLYNKYGSAPIVNNTQEIAYNIATDLVDNDTYSNNFTTSVYKSIKDSTYTINRYFIPSLQFYTDNHTNSIFNGKTMYYIDDNKIYKIINSEPTVITTSSFISEDLTNSICLSSSNSFISTCYINTCYFKILSTILDINIGVCSMTNKYNALVSMRDLLYMTLEIIKYLTDINNITQIQKLIEAIDVCGGLCASTSSTSNNTNCGCNG